MKETLRAAIVAAGLIGLAGCVAPNSEARTSKLAASDEAAARKLKGGKNPPGSGNNPEGIGKITGRTADHPSFSGNPLLAGGIICRCPVDSNGTAGAIQTQSFNTGAVRTSAGPGSTTREVAIYVQHMPLLYLSPLTLSGEPSQGQEVKQGQTTVKQGTFSAAQIAVLPILPPCRAVVTDKIIPDHLEGTVDLGPMLLNARRESPNYRKIGETLEGTPHWWILSPGWTLGSTGLDPTIFLAELYSSDPDSGAPPLDVAVVARRTGTGPWQPASGYLLRGDRLMRITAVLEDGLPARVESAEVPEPPLEEFLVSKEASIQSGRLRTGVLLTAKNRTLPKMLREGTNSSLTDLLTRIEKTILDLNHERELVNTLAQKAIESGGNAGGLPELSLVYKERIEVLKPILSAIKDELANRGR